MKPPPALKWVVASLVIAASALGARYLAAYLRSGEPTLLTLADDGHLGELREGETTTRKLTIINTSDEEVHVQRMYGDCRCTTFEPSSLRVAARGQAEVEVRIQLDRTNEIHDWTELWIEVDAVAGERNVSTRWRVSGRVVSDVVLDSRSLTFGDLVLDPGNTISRTLRVRTRRPVETVIATIAGGKFTVETARDADGYALTVRPGDRSPGFVNAVMRVAVHLNDADSTLTFDIPISALLLLPVEVSPERLLCQVPIGTKVREEVRLQDRAGKPILPRHERSSQFSGVVDTRM